MLLNVHIWLLNVSYLYVYCCNTLSRQEGTTPLFIAAQEGFTDIARLLLAKGAKPSAMDKVTTAYINAYIHTYVHKIQ